MMVDRRFGQAGARLVIEELLVGREASFFVLSDGTRALPLGSAEDHKRALDGDAGPNTGGMGAYAPSSLFDAGTQARVMSEIVLPVLEGMRSEGSEFRGFLFVGLMLTAEGPRRCRRAGHVARVDRGAAARGSRSRVGRLSGHVRYR